MQPGGIAAELPAGQGNGGESLADPSSDSAAIHLANSRHHPNRTKAESTATVEKFAESPTDNRGLGNSPREVDDTD